MDKCKADYANGQGTPARFMDYDQLCAVELNLSKEDIDAIRQAEKGKSLGQVLGKRGRPKKGENNPDNIRFSHGIERLG